LNRRLRLSLFSSLVVVAAGAQRSAPAAIPSLEGAAPARYEAETPSVARLRLYNTHTGERADVVFRRSGQYVPEGIAALEHHLRDFRRDEMRAFDPRLFDLLVELAEAVGEPGAEFHVISGYRSPATNQMLRERSRGVAQRSLHMQAQAIDVRLPGVPTSRLRDAALELARGGVGYYASSDFIHVDTGRVRRW
jgi:uncharacterized protein YcbK (DUF882 family)